MNAEIISPIHNQMEENRLYRLAFIFSLITIFYNLFEGLVSTYFGYADETLALFGFGLDSFIEVISGIGIAHMIIRMKNQPSTERDLFEVTALRVTGVAFYLLVVGLSLTAIMNVLTHHQPETTFWGIVVSSISIITMYALIRAKLYVGHKLDSQPIIADANCTRVCLIMSVILLVSSSIYELTGFNHIDTLGALGVVYFSWKEGRECFEKARQKKGACCGC